MYGKLSTQEDFLEKWCGGTDIAKNHISGTCERPKSNPKRLERHSSSPASVRSRLRAAGSRQIRVHGDRARDIDESPRIYRLPKSSGLRNSTRKNWVVD
ncbi:hypothetical protein EVAR_3918_1 [Eumeta japonica]|uniref:Uncharacterized protein n=1 Tax=Eumeta variegata TaxID=151549 RepID=A0A4C1SU31_EUMVA|nr:hypothetical protein EVAR_3918_1 [Eumeta japonica]